ncbi:MAG: hypothetical protein Q4G60_05295 [bacterium]|nr:hypothetical protein [bacterium]
MKTISPEKKLELVRRIREESNQNQSVMTGRETILSTSGPKQVEGKLPNYRKLRFLLAVSLFLFCFWVKYTGSDQIIGYEDLKAVLKQEIDLNGIDFIEDLPYTLTDADQNTDIGMMKTEEGY